MPGGIVKIGPIEVNVSDQVPPDEIWLTVPDGYEREERIDAGGLTIRVYERHRIVGKIVNVGNTALPPK
jgi:hypothetical protein